MEVTLCRNTAVLQAYRVDPVLEEVQKGNGSGRCGHRVSKLAALFSEKGSLAEKRFGKKAAEVACRWGKSKSADTSTFDGNVSSMTNLLTKVLDSEGRGGNCSNYKKQLYDLVAEIGKQYRGSDEVHFHKFQHACHVTEAAYKLFKSIRGGGSDDTTNGIAATILNDPLYEMYGFALVFSALIHDIGHRGVPNAQLIKEDPELAAKYDNRSVAEKNSTDVGLNLFLSSERYSDLRKLIFQDEAKKARFETLVYEIVLATDIADKELQQKIRQQWEDRIINATTRKNHDGNVTIVLQTIIQAADVSHTMHSFDTYSEWNGYLFDEMYAAYQQGRADKDPSKSWYCGEFGFFDFYITPLVMKLKDSKIFDPAVCQQFLDNVQYNRKRWEDSGSDIVQSFVHKYQK